MKPRHRLIVCMGVSGSGKSTLAARLSATLSLPWIEADDLHSNANRAHMAAGEALTDAMRAPWVEAVCGAVSARQQDLILAFSGLRAAHRQQLRELGLETRFLLLQTDPAVLAERMKHRPGHFMKAELLPSQLATLQMPEGEDDVDLLNAGLSPDQLVGEALRRLERAGRSPS